ITARVTDPSGLTAEAETTVVVDHPPAVTIDTPADGAVVFTDAGPVTFAATALDAEDGDLAGALGWTSSLDGPIGTGGSVSGALSVGLHTVSAAVTDARGVTSQARIRLRVRAPNAAPVVTITAPADGTAVPAGTPVSLATTATDDFDGDLSGRIEWSSDVAGALGAGATRTVTLHEGTHRLTATVTDAGGLTGVAERTVVVLPPNTYPAIAIDAPTDGAALFAGMPLLVAAHATDEEDGELSGVIRWSSDRDGPLGTGAMLTMASLSAGAHTITASVTDAAGATSTASVSVVVG